MNILEKIEELKPNIKPSTGEDVDQMLEDIYHYFSGLDDFEVLRVDQTKSPDKMILAACQTTMDDPYFRLVVAHTWQRDLAFDDQWSSFEDKDDMTIFRFITWDDDAYISGEIWFERAKNEAF